MLKKFFIAMGVISTCLIASCAVFVGFAGYNAADEAPKNKAVAEAITRHMARAWNVNDLKPYFVAVAARQVNFAEAQLTFNKLRTLGSLKTIEQAQQTGFKIHKGLGGALTKSATVLIVAEFENGRAAVTMRLQSEDGEMKLLHVNVTPIGEVRNKAQQA
jgi:hypothetical protein